MDVRRRSTTSREDHRGFRLACKTSSGCRRRRGSGRIRRRSASIFFRPIIARCKRPPTGGKVLSACVLLSVLGGLMALTMAAPRVYYAMAKDGAFFPVFGRLHSRFGTPANAVLLQT